MTTHRSPQAFSPVPAAPAAPSRWGLLAAALLAACGASDVVPDAGGGGGMDMGVPADLSSGPSPDLSTAQPMPCELPYEQRLIATPAAGAVTITPSPDGNGYTAEIDASAGGGDQAPNNAYVYLDLVSGKKVSSGDVEAQKAKTWDIAFKRWQVKINSGDSGPGGVVSATVGSADLSQVTQAPASGYVEDDYFDAKCQLMLDGNNGLRTALSDWYEYNFISHQLTPKKQVYVLKRRDGQGSIKFQFSAYYKGSTAGIYSVRWAFLP